MSDITRPPPALPRLNADYSAAEAAASEKAIRKARYEYITLRNRIRN